MKPSMITRLAVVAPDDLFTYIQCHLRVAKAKKTILYDAVIAHANTSPRKEPKDWMETLIWDGKPRIDRWLCGVLTHHDAAMMVHDRAESGTLIRARLVCPRCGFRSSGWPLI